MDRYYETFCRYCGARLDPDNGLCSEYECFRCGRRPGELVLTRRVGGELRFVEIDCAPLEPAVVTTSADLYGPEDPVEILIAAPGAWRREASLEVRRQGLVLDRIDVDLSPQGNALVSLPPFEVGKYVVQLTVRQPRGRTLTQDHGFQVTYRDLSVLRAIVLESSRQNEMLVFRLLVTWMAGEPYEGPIDLIVLDDQDEVEIFRMALDVHRGRVSGAFRTPEWVGPFSARLSTPEGQTTWIRFLDDEVGFPDEILGLSFGPRRRLSLSAWDGREECHGIRFLPESETDAPVVLAEIIGRRGELVARRDLPRLYVQVRHPGSGGRVENAVYTGVKEGERIPFSATPPYVFYLVAVDFNDGAGEFDPALVFEGWGAFFVWSEGRAVVRCPRRVEPGTPLRIEVDGTRGTEGFLVVRQVGLPSTAITSRLAAALYENVRSNCLLEGPETYAEGEPTHEAEDFVFEDEEDSDPTAGLPSHLRQIPGLDRLIDDLATCCTSPAPERPAVRQEDLRVLLLRRVMLDGPVEFAVRSPERIGDVETVFYQCGPHGWRIDRAITEVGGEDYVFGSTPEFLFPDDSVEVDLRYRSEGPARLVAGDGAGGVPTGRQVEGEGRVSVPIEGPGVLEWSLEGRRGTPAVRRRIEAGGRRKITRTRFRYLAPGETYEADRVVAYRDPAAFRDDLADSLARYPHDCSEQLSSRLRALGCLWPPSPSHRIVLGFRIRRLARSLLEYAETMDDGRWALWPGEEADERVGAQIVKNLAPFLSIEDFPEIRDLARRSAEHLRAAGWRDNELLPVDPVFLEPDLETPEAAAAAILHGPPEARPAALERLVELARRDDQGRPAWEGRSWAGRWESTAKAARALASAGHPLADEAIASLSDRLIDGRLYSTTDSIALIDLFDELSRSGPAQAFDVDGRPAPAEGVAVGRRVRCLEGRLLVRCDAEEELERPRAPFDRRIRIEVASGGGRLEVGQRIRLLVDFGSPDPESICRLYLPPSLSLCRTGAKEQEVHLPLRVRRLAVDCLCVRRGEGAVRALVENLYREEERSWVEGPRIRVG